MKYFTVVITMLAMLLVAAVPVVAQTTKVSTIACTTGTMTQTKTVMGGTDVYSIAWVSGTDGVAVNSVGIVIYGEIKKAIFDPAASSLAPSDDYDVTLKDANGADLLFGLGANHDTANTEVIVFVDPSSVVFSTTTLVQAVNTLNKFYPWRAPTSGSHTLTVTNSGSANGGTVKIYVKRL